MGDPLGIGPEIIAKSLGTRAWRDVASGLVIFGSHDVLRAAAERSGARPFWSVVSKADWLGGGDDADGVVLVDEPVVGPTPGAPGPSEAGGRASFAWVEGAIASCRLPRRDPRRCDAIVTAPISKSSWHMAGRDEFPGHTELLAERFGAKRHGMLFVGPSLRIMLATIHVPLMRVGSLLTPRRVLDAIELSRAACIELGISRPRIAVCGLNPHAGEGGLLGEEDERRIAPAIARAAAAGLDVSGPLPADTVFGAAAAPPHGKGRFDCVVAMYHDQGLIPAKLVDGMRTVNVTVGLGVPRTSPAHGTAFDIAGADRADDESMWRAIELAARMAARRA